VRRGAFPKWHFLHLERSNKGSSATRKGVAHEVGPPGPPVRVSEQPHHGQDVRFQQHCQPPAGEEAAAGGAKHA
jgi:hypothetical protein